MVNGNSANRHKNGTYSYHPLAESNLDHVIRHQSPAGGSIDVVILDLRMRTLVGITTELFLPNDAKWGTEVLLEKSVTLREPTQAEWDYLKIRYAPHPNYLRQRVF